MSIINYFAIFNGYNLTTVPGLTVLATNPWMPARRKLALNILARSNKSKTNSAFYTERIITVRVCIQRNSRDAVEQAIDILMTNIQGLEKELWLAQSGTVRKYYCTYSGYAIQRAGGAYWEADLQFTCSDNFGYDTSYTPIITNRTTSTATAADQYNFTGSAPFQAPIITVKLTAVTGGAPGTMTIGNSNTGQNISITRTWAVNDFVEIDSVAETVKVNGAIVAFTGAFPKFATGLGTISYADTFTTRTVVRNAYYYKRWI